jgi:hypothetical protein
VRHRDQLGPGPGARSDTSCCPNSRTGKYDTRKVMSLIRRRIRRDNSLVRRDAAEQAQYRRSSHRISVSHSQESDRSPRLSIVCPTLRRGKNRRSSGLVEARPRCDLDNSSSPTPPLFDTTKLRLVFVRRMWVNCRRSISGAATNLHAPQQKAGQKATRDFEPAICASNFVTLGGTTRIRS